MQMSDVEFDLVRNRNEKRVKKAIEQFLINNTGSARAELVDAKDIRDIYALALNQLPARYAQQGTIVVGDPVRDEDARRAVMEAYETVADRPKI